MFRLNWCIVILFCLANNGDCKCEENKQKKVQLRNNLLCNYDPLERPVLDHKETTNVTLKLMLKNMEYDEHSAGLTINFWLSITWIDGMLNWKPEDHDDIKNLIVDPITLWQPDLSVYNRLEQSGSASLLDSERCVLKHNGRVSCVSPNNHQILCEPNLKYFPFDQNECTMTVGSWIHEGEELNITTDGTAIDKGDFVDYGEFRLKSTKITHVIGRYECCPNSTFPYLLFHFTIERHSGVHVCIAIVPAITMAVLTFLTFFMEIKNSERTTIIVANIILHMLYLQFYAWTLPIGPESPLLLTYTRDSLIMTTFMLVLTILLRKLIQCKMYSPKWIAAATGFAMNSRAVQLIFMFDGSLKEVAERLGDDDGRNIIENSQTNSNTNTDWLVLAKLLDRLGLILYFIIYLIMFIAFIP